MRLIFILFILLFCSTAIVVQASTLTKVLNRGELLCGINGNWVGMSYIDKLGNPKGMDIDVCRAVAAAIFEDSSAVEFTPLASKVRFKALMNSEVDILLRNSTWNYHRDTYAIEFAGISFYDGQGFLVKRSAKITSLEEIPKNAAICVQKDTTTEANLINYIKKHKWQVTVKAYTSNKQATGEFFQGKCQLMTGDTIELLSIKQNYAPNKNDYIILNEKISKEPLGPAVKDSDSQWINIVRWTLYALLEAEDKGINSTNIDELLASKNKHIQFLLGVRPGIGKGLGLNDKWFYHTIKNVGNYAEIYQRHFGPNTNVYVERGLNALWKDGGIMVSPTLE